MDEVQESGHSGGWKCDSHLLARTVCRMCCPCCDSPLMTWTVSNHSSTCVSPAGDPKSWEQDSMDQPRAFMARGMKREHPALSASKVRALGPACQQDRPSWGVSPKEEMLGSWTTPEISPAEEGMHSPDLSRSLLQSHSKEHLRTAPVLTRNSGAFSTISWGCQQVASQEAFVGLQTTSLALCVCCICTCWLLSRGRS